MAAIAPVGRSYSSHFIRSIALPRYERPKRFR
jgi:hypothetical protein